MMILVLAAVVIGVVWLSRRGMVNGQPDKGTDVLEVLRQRYALGEITREQFEEMKETLRM